ncbi:MAG: hypothetical protein JO093_24635 [Acidobacteria bacterium]|nr:hypothetical protein [Acidobacteriota bacterium]MBV9188816.1 hypothetical protein [Acidobacteriota bacterium]
MSPSDEIIEWLGARYPVATIIREGDERFQPDAVLWMEIPTRFLISATLIDPRKAVSFADVFLEAMEQVNTGLRPRPASIRVPSEGLAKELRRVTAGIPVTVAPVPELDRVFADLEEKTAADMQPSYLDDGNIPLNVAAEFFEAAQSLFYAAPWTVIQDHQLVGVDIPKVRVKGACLSVIGNAGESSGLLLFRSLEDYLSFGTRRAKGRARDRFSVRSMSFGPRKELPTSMMREIKEHHWPIAGPQAYPTLFGLDRAMEPLPITARDYRIMTKLSKAFLIFFRDYRSIFETDRPDNIQRSFIEDDLIVTFTAPF